MMRRGRHGYPGRGRISVLPSYPDHLEPRTSSRISGSASADAENNATPLTANERREEYYASLEDVSQVRNILRRLWSSPSSSSPSSSRKVSLPDEVIDMILDEAEYWPSVVTSLRTTPFVISTDGDTECLRTPPLCYDPDRVDELDKQGGSHHSSARNGSNNTPYTLLHRGMYPCRKIIFDISSHDQGWGGERAHQGTFEGSWTWLSAYISPHKRKHEADQEKMSSSSESDQEEKRSTSSHPRPFLPEPSKLQCNRTATINSTDYHIVWHHLDDIDPDSDEAQRIEQETGRGRATLDGSAVREMQVGDEVSVWLRARFAGWRNHVDKLSVRVFWAA